MVNLTYNPCRTVAKGVKVAIASSVAEAALAVIPTVIPFPFNLLAKVLLTGAVAAFGNVAKHKHGVKVPF
jgi:hypothetical protein